MTSIGKYAFYQCASLKSISIPPPVADKDAFGSYNATVYVPGHAVEAYKEAENWNSFEIRPIDDVNSDEAVNTGDMSAVYGAILGGDPQGFTDLNCDGNINTGDVSALYLIILGN